MGANEKEREKQLAVEVEKLKAKLRQRERQLFGRRSEYTKGKNEGQQAQVGRRRRGQQRGAAGHGRRRHGALPAVEETYDLDPAQRRCPTCQCAYKPLAETMDSKVVEVEVSARRRVIRRQRYRPSCRCPAQPGIVTAAGPAKLIPKSGLGVSAWVLILIDKFPFQRPTYRLLSDRVLSASMHARLPRIRVDSGAISNGGGMADGGAG